MDFLILGPLEVRDGDRPVAVGGMRQRALLGMLLLHANEVVSTDRLIDELWEGDRREDAAKALRVAVSRLRKTLGPGGGEALVTRRPGYELRLEPGELDLDRFERHVAAGQAALERGDPVAASTEFGEGLALWRGPSLADLADESFCQVEIARLEELRIFVQEERMAADPDRGLDAELVGALSTLVAKHPLRERLRAQLMLALYRAGRQADALEAYAEARRVLVGELGIEPGRELHDLQRTVLEQDASLEAGQARLREPAHSESFVGRADEWATLQAALDSAMSGNGGVVLLAGEPGIGKSRLADEVVSAAREKGARVLVGRCWEAGGAPAFWPWVQPLRAYVREADPELLRAQLGDGAADLAQLLPELRELFPDLPGLPPMEAEGARFRLFDAASSFLKAATWDVPIVLVLDDVHAADEPSLLLLQFVARDLADSRLLVVCAYRDVGPTPGAQLSTTVAELLREPQTTQIELSGLGGRDVAEYIELSTGIAANPSLVEAIHAGTAGNPLFVSELVRLLDAEGRLAEPDAHHAIPPGVRALIGQRIARLTERCRGLLVAASVLGREFALEALAQLSDLPGDELLDVLDEASASACSATCRDLPAGSASNTR